jgi:integrase
MRDILYNYEPENDPPEESNITPIIPKAEPSSLWLNPNVISRLVKENGSPFSDSSKSSTLQVINQFNNYLADKELALDEASIKEFLKLTDDSNTFTARKFAIKRVLLNQPSVKRDMDFRLKIDLMFKSFGCPTKTKVVHENKYLSYSEVQMLIDYGKNPDNVGIIKRRDERIWLNKRMSLMIDALFQTASRIDAFMNIKVDKCEFTDKKVSICLAHDKFSKSRNVRIEKSLFEEIIKVFKPKEYLFENRQGKKIHRSNFSKQLQEYAERAGLEKHVHPHIFRHSYAMARIYGKDPAKSITNNTDAKNVEKVSRYLGHERTETTYRYYLHGQFTDEDVHDFPD